MTRHLGVELIKTMCMKQQCFIKNEEFAGCPLLRFHSSLTESEAILNSSKRIKIFKPHCSADRLLHFLQGIWTAPEAAESGSDLSGV